MPSTLHAYDDVAGIFFPIAVAVFACVVITLAVLLVLGARRRAPDRRSEANRLETVYALVLGATVGVLVWITFTAETPIDRLVTRPALTVKVVAAQWSWTFRYANGTTVSAVASWSPPVAVVPAGVEVQFDATSRDVIHGFWIPGLHYLRQVFPGFTARFDLLFAKPGRYEGECAVFCGLQHPQMHFEIDAVSPFRFRTWLASGGRSL
jgi:cytochrome c oxidase subunit 2